MLCPSTMRVAPGCSRAAMPTRVLKSLVYSEIEGVGDQPFAAEPGDDVVVAASVFTQPVGENDDPPRRAPDICRGPDVIDDAHIVDTVEGTFDPRHRHQGQRRPNVGVGT
jgi:hypothetical protein